MANRPLIVFDVNETLLDLGTLEPTFENLPTPLAVAHSWIRKVPDMRLCIALFLRA
jgi:hypothetical protein